MAGPDEDFDQPPGLPDETVLGKLPLSPHGLSDYFS